MGVLLLIAPFVLIAQSKPTIQSIVRLIAPQGMVQPFAVALEPGGSLLVAEMEPSHRIVRVMADGRRHVLAGNGTPGDSGDFGPGLDATLRGPHHLERLPDGRVLIADTFNRRVRLLDLATGRILPFAGSGVAGMAGEGAIATSAQLRGAYGTALDPRGRWLYIADLENRRIRRVEMATLLLSTFAGTGERGVPRDGSRAIEAPLVDPRSVAVAPSGHVYILERGGHALRVVAPDGTIRTVAGTGAAGPAADDVDAMQAAFNGPKHVTVAADGGVWIADTENHVVRRYDPRTRRVVRVVGTGSAGARVGRTGLETELSRPHGVTVARDGTLYIADSDNDRVVVVKP